MGIVRIYAVLGWVALIALSNVSFAAYDANIQGQIKSIYTYPSGLVLFQLSNQPTSHPGCSPIYFAIATDVAESPANRMYTRLLTLHTTAAIGYDSQGNCGNSYIRVHNIGGE